MKAKTILVNKGKGKARIHVLASVKKGETYTLLSKAAIQGAQQSFGINV